ncbi:MAG: sugar-binding domain-containing protein, partial [Candidatus Fimenecus sp.]
MKNTISLNKDWLFYYGYADKDTDFESINCEKTDLPHTWNNLDGQDGGDDYARGTGWYMKKIHIQKENRRCFLEFYGVNSVANVYVNGVYIGEHRGGYTLFRFDITGAVKDGENTIIVCADNSPFPDVIPLEADFTFFGGIYREVNLILTDELHFALDNFGSDGVTLSYNNDTTLKETAKLNI